MTRFHLSWAWWYQSDYTDLAKVFSESERWSTLRQSKKVVILVVSINGILRPKVIARSELWIYQLRLFQTMFRNWAVIKVAFGLDKKKGVWHGLPRWDFAPPTRRDILWALSDDMIRKAWSCTIHLSVNWIGRLRVTQMNHISRIEKRVELLKGWRVFAYSLTRYIVRQKGLRRKPHWKVCRHDSMVLGSWHVLLGATTNWSIASQTPIVSKSPWACWVAHLRAGASIVSVGLDPNWTRTGLVSWTRGDQNRLLVSGLTSVVEPITTAYIRWGAAPRRG